MSNYALARSVLSRCYEGSVSTIQVMHAVSAVPRQFDDRQLEAKLSVGRTDARDAFWQPVQSVNVR